MKKKLVIARIQVVKGKEQDYIDLVEPIIERTKIESGTLAYTYYQNMNNPSEFLAYEEYTGEEGFAEHCLGEPYLNFKKMVDSLLAKEIDMQSFDLLIHIKNER